MTDEHFSALMKAAGAKKGDDGWHETAEGRLLTLYVSRGGSTLTVSRIEAVRLDSSLVEAKTVRGERYLLAREDVFAGAAEGPENKSRKAGFV